MKNCIAIIPARIGSKRIKLKNIKNFLGKPIISVTLDKIFEANIFSKVFVSTDSIKIKKIVEKKRCNSSISKTKKFIKRYCKY